MRSATLLILAVLVAGALGALRPKRSSVSQTCNGNFVCPTSGSGVPTSAGYDPTTGLLTCGYSNGAHCQYDQNTPSTTTILPPVAGSDSRCSYDPVTTVQCADAAQGNALTFQYTGGNYIYCKYAPAPGTTTSFMCSYLLTTGALSGPYANANCPTPVSCAGTGTTNPVPRSAYRREDNFTALKRKLAARAHAVPRAQTWASKPRAQRV